jgi:hypothetical protein
MLRDFERLVYIAGMALESEDRYYLGAIAANKLAYPHDQGGILRMKNERYYQFTAARALASSYPYGVKVEFDTHDIVLHYPESDKKLYAAVEMKRWMSPEGKQEIQGIKSDIQKLLSAAAEHALMLIISANPPGKTIDNIKNLSDDISLAVYDHFAFATIDPAGKEVEFWIAGFQVK